MHYYEVWVSSPKYHSDAPLTYHFEGSLKRGTVVTLGLQRQTVVGIVLQEVERPSFKTKPVLAVVSASPIPKELIELIEWIKAYYPAPLGQVVSLFVPNVLTTKGKTILDTTLVTKSTSDLPPLTKEQRQALETIKQNDTILLHGNTGSGKTRVYLELIKDTLSRDKSVILLTPEIGLTPQLAVACSSVFPDKVVTIHSDLTVAKRRAVWRRILEADEPLIVIGARSALFSPINGVGLIVLDEFHETTYKQEQMPHYQTARVAAKLASLHKARLILGSATPTVSDYYIFQQKKLPIVRMRSRALEDGSSSKIFILDLKNRDEFRVSPWLSTALIDSIGTALEKKEQSLIFLNRRGTARLVLCQNCGWQALCPQCDLTLTYHSDTHNMQCHTCGYTQKTPLNCPECRENNIVFHVIGTKALVTELQRLFPSAEIKRFDSDVSKSEKLEQQYESLKHGGIDILVGTQILGKGLDLPRLSTLGIVQADTSLSFPDYTSEERTYQLLSQVIGRVNRGHVSGTVYIQTYRPDNPLLEAAISQDYETFFNLQLTERKKYGFPPFRFTLKLICSRAKRTTAQDGAEKLSQTLRKSARAIEVVGPSPCFVEKIQNRYRWQIIIKSTERQELLNVIKDLPANWTYDLDPINLL